jgi:TorA maturation chaperone TorD
MTATIMDTSQAFSLLSSMYLCKPTKEVILHWKLILAEDTTLFMHDLKKALYEINTKSDQELEDLLWEYTRLFIGPYKLPCPPWESVYTSPKKLMMQNAAEEVREIYNEGGLTMNAANIMPDHIGAELNFLSVLFHGINYETEKKDYYISITEQFLTEHIMKWVPDFTRDMEDAADISFYRVLARVTRDLIALDNPQNN